MKKLNINEGIKLLFSDDTLNAYDFIIGILRNPPQGINFESMAELAPTMVKIKNAKDKSEPFVLLEKREHGVLIRTIKSASFRLADPAIVAYVESLADLEDVEVKEKAE